MAGRGGTRRKTPLRPAKRFVKVFNTLAASLGRFGVEGHAKVTWAPERVRKTTNSKQQHFLLLDS